MTRPLFSNVVTFRSISVTPVGSSFLKHKSSRSPCVFSRNHPPLHPVPPPLSAAATMSAMDVEPPRERVKTSPRSIMYTHGSKFSPKGARDSAPFKTSSGYSLSPKHGNSPPLRISTMAIADQAARFGLDPGHGQNFTRFGLEAHAEATTQPMEDDELDMDLAAPVDEVGDGRDPNVFKSFWNCCNGMRS